MQLVLFPIFHEACLVFGLHSLNVSFDRLSAELNGSGRYQGYA